MSDLPETRRRWLLIAALLVVALFALLVFRTRLGFSGSSASASASASAASARARPRVAAWRPVYLSGGETKRVDARAIGAFEGRVISNGSGKGVADAELTFVGPAGAEATRSAADGAFRLTPAREGSYELSLVTAKGFLPFASELGSSPIVVTARRGSGISGMRLALDPAIEYTGQVVDPRGSAVAAAHVRIRDADNFELGSVPSEFVSDANGEFKFSAPDGSIVEAGKTGFSPGRARVDFGVQVSHRLTVKLRDQSAESVGAIRGRVIDPSGAPRSDALVVARIDSENPASEAAVSNPGARARSGERGDFSLEGLTSGFYTVIASAPESAPAAARRVAVGGAPITLVLSNGVTLRGRVTDKASGEPIVAFTIALSEKEGPLARHAVRVASSFDSEGRYLVDHLAPGAYAVSASAAGYASSAEFDVAVERDATADFALERGARLIGVVRDEKTRAPLEFAKVSLEGRLAAGASSVSTLSVAVTNNDGSFELAGLGPGEHSVLCAAAGHHGRLIGGIHVVGSESIGPIEISLSPTAPGEEPRIELFGIGAVLGAKDDALVIGKIIPGGGAADAGLVPGDAILAVDGVLVTQLGFDDAIQKIRGPEGTSVVLRVRRAAGGEPANMSVVRKRIKA